MWYVYVSVLTFNSIAILTKKKLQPIVYYASIFWGLFSSDFTDRWTDKWDWYGFFEPQVINSQTTTLLF